MASKIKIRDAEADNRLVLVGLVCLAVFIGLIIVATVIIAGGVSE